jgi:acyl carrier protein
MERDIFILKLMETIEINPNDDLNRALSKLDSLQILSIISFIDENFSKTLPITEIKKIQNIDDLIKLIGPENIE